MVNETKQCRICGSKELDAVLDLGLIYPSAFVKADFIASEEAKAPLALARCKVCGLVQLKDMIDLDLMYRQYWYASALNKSMVSSLKNVVDDIESKIELEDGGTVLDIGCNDGTMLQLFTKDVFKVGFDPALNLAKPDCFFINDYFSAETYTRMLGRVSAKVITAIAMFYDLPDPHSFLEDVKKVLDENGLFVVQFTDLYSMFKAGAFDNICHEHLEYYRLEDVVNLLAQHGLDVVDVSYNDVNGGSVRVTACCTGARVPSPSVLESLENEREYFKVNTFEAFQEFIEATKEGVRKFLDSANEYGKKVFLLGASTKGNTFLQICGITNKDVPFAAEVNKDKFGLKTLGSNVRIVSEEEAFGMRPDYFLVPVWHFKKSLLGKKTIIDYISSGGKLVFPLPEFHIVTKNVEA